MVQVLDEVEGDDLLFIVVVPGLLEAEEDVEGDHVIVMVVQSLLRLCWRPRRKWLTSGKKSNAIRVCVESIFLLRTWFHQKEKPWTDTSTYGSQ